MEDLADLIESSPDVHASIIDLARMSKLNEKDAEFAVKEELADEDQKLLQVFMSPEFVEKIIKQKNAGEYKSSIFSQEIDGKPVRIILTVQPK